MFKDNRNHGFTILEITIAISMTMAGLVLAMVMINSRLRQENFQRGSSAFVTIIDDILNDVSTNNWPHVSGWACKLNPNDNNLHFEMKADHETGEGECLYVGKVIQFGDKKKMTEEDNTYIVHTIMTHRNALIPTYNFDGIAELNHSRIHPLGVVEQIGDFSTRDTKTWPNGMHISQVYYDENEDNDLTTSPMNKVFLRGIAVVQQSGHGLKPNDLLLTVSGEGQIGIRVVHDIDTMGARDPNSPRLDGDKLARSLIRTPGETGSSIVPLIDTSAIEHNFKTPIYICLSDGRGNKVLATLGGGSSSLLAETEFDEDKIDDHCGP